MKLPWRSASIRLRLTGWYAVVLTAMLIIYATTTYVAVRHEFLEQLDERLHEDFEAAESQLTRTAEGRVQWTSTAHADDHGEEARVLEVWSITGEQLHRSGPDVTLPLLASASVGPSYRYDAVAVDGQRWRTLASLHMVGTQSVILRVARSEEPLRGELGEIFMVLALGLPLVVVLAGIGGYVLARRALAPIDHLASEAKRVTAERLHQRLTTSNPNDEIGRLTGVINDTLARLDASFDQLRRFTADASHELRTPLAVVRGIGEAAVAERRSPAEYEESIGSILEEIDRMTTLVDTLLRLSHGDAGTIRLSRELVDVGQLARDVASSLGILAEERNQSISLDITDGIVAPVDRLIVREALTNVLDNAIKYSPQGGTVSIRVEQRNGQALVAIADEGPGIPPAHRERIFHRFFRVDEARAREHGGAGLGLAIAKWAVEMHGGEIIVDPRPSSGAEFHIVLPITPPAGETSDQHTRPTHIGESS
jgi:heavy metal sensor kinase